MKKLTFFFLIILMGCGDPAPKEMITDVLVVGGGTSGVAAGIQAARSGANVVVVEPGPWLGGMLTAAGVSATDGNHNLPSGLWEEFRQKLYDHYGSPEALATGWVSMTQFEPQVGARIWKEMANAESKLTVIHGFHFGEILKRGNKVMGGLFTNGKETIQVKAHITIDATELGDVIAASGATYRTGQDTKADPHNVHIQDLTYAAILQDFGEGADKTIEKPANYDPSMFECCCKKGCNDTTEKPHPCQTMLDYAKLPNGYYMLNWPIHGNDAYMNVIDLSFEERQKAYQQAKDKTLGMVYYIQTVLGYKNIGLADSIFPTEDKLALMPYHREGRRGVGKVTLEVEDILDPYKNPDRPFYQSAIAVGDYPLDHHHKENQEAEKEEFPPIPSYSIPYGCLVPEKVEGLLFAEKNISVSHDVNGTTRLQPVVVLIGQAAGAAAALCALQKIEPWELKLTLLQEELLRKNCMLLPYLDVPPSHKYFLPVQNACLEGIMKGHGVPFKWENQTWFYPDSVVNLKDFEGQYYIDKKDPGRNVITRGEVASMIELDYLTAKKKDREAYPGQFEDLK